MPRILENNIRDGSSPPSPSPASSSGSVKEVVANPGAAIAIMENGRYDQSLNLDAITMRQLKEDVVAYEYDLNFCNSQLSQHDLTPQESRTLQLRRLDMGHNIRRCNHRLQLLDFTTGGAAVAPPRPSGSPAVDGGGFTAANQHLSPAKRAIKRSTSEALITEGSETPSAKRPRASGGWVPVPKAEGGDDAETHTELKRLGFWRCRLCVSTKYLLAGAGRQPSAPCKWPLKDIAKMITHYMDMHGEHEPDERCKELGDALDKNRGPFEYWLRRSRSQNLEDGSVIDECVETLQAGQLPDVLRRLSRAAAGFPQ